MSLRPSRWRRRLADQIPWLRPRTHRFATGEPSRSRSPLTGSDSCAALTGFPPRLSTDNQVPPTNFSDVETTDLTPPSIAAPLSRRTTPPARDRRKLNQLVVRFTGLRLPLRKAPQAVGPDGGINCLTVLLPRLSAKRANLRRVSPTDRRLAVGGAARPKNHRWE